ncbi:unnamed protein product, partial [Symbiodinium sp. CCMP2456]
CAENWRRHLWSRADHVVGLLRLGRLGQDLLPAVRRSHHHVGAAGHVRCANRLGARADAYGAGMELVAAHHAVCHPRCTRG